MLDAIRYLVNEVQKINNRIGASWYPKDKQLSFYYGGIVIATYTFENRSDVIKTIPIAIRDVKKRLTILKSPSLARDLEYTWKRIRFKPGFRKEMEI